MARSRNIKPGFMENDELPECHMSSHLLFACLWMIADKEGRFKDRPKRIKAQCLPYYRDASGEDISTLDQRSVNVDASLDQLQAKGFVVRYEVDGERFCQITNWSKHQSPHHKEASGDIPPPNGKPNDLQGETNVDSSLSQHQAKVESSLAQAPKSSINNQRIRESENPQSENPVDRSPFGGSPEFREHFDGWIENRTEAHHQRPGASQQQTALMEVGRLAGGNVERAIEIMRFNRSISSKHIRKPDKSFTETVSSSGGVLLDD